MNDKQPILSLCIPTYNRASILGENLSIMQQQLSEIDSGELELIVSNNCSPDNTEDVVKSFIGQGMPIRYNCNEKNLGADGNFLRCMQMARGKYVYLLGDDDFLADNALAKLLNFLRNKEYGIVYIETRLPFDGSVTEYHNLEEFIHYVSYFYTFCSGSIFRREAIAQVREPERYFGSSLLQMPFYLHSTLMYDTNAVVHFPMIAQVGADSKNNGGYNFFEVFVRNYLTIMSEYIINKDLLVWLKKDIWPFVWGYTKPLLIRKNTGNFQVENGWQILLKFYWSEWYFWKDLIKYPFGVIKRKIKKILHI